MSAEAEATYRESWRNYRKVSPLENLTVQQHRLPGKPTLQGLITTRVSLTAPGRLGEETADRRETSNLQQQLRPIRIAPERKDGRNHFN